MVIGTIVSILARLAPSLGRLAPRLYRGEMSKKEFIVELSKDLGSSISSAALKTLVVRKEKNQICFMIEVEGKLYRRCYRIDK